MGIPQSVFKNNIFGFTAGGPVRRDKTFFFAAFQQNDLHSTDNFPLQVPTTDAVTRLRSLFSNNPRLDLYLGALGGLRGTAAPLNIALGVDPQTGVDRGAVQFASAAYVLPATNDGPQWLARIDHFQSSEKHRLSWRYSYDSQLILPRTVSFPGFVQETGYSHPNVLFADSYTFSPAYTNEFRFSYGRPDENAFTTWPGSSPLALTLRFACFVASAEITIQLMRTLAKDLRQARRMLLRSPGFAAIAILTVALGIGANTALFSIVNGVLLNPLPYFHSNELVAISEKRPGVDQSPPVYLNYLDWQRETRAFASMAIYRNQDYNLTGTTEGQRLSGYMVSAEFFPTLGVKPVAGRLFGPDDDRLGAAPVAILGGGYWNRQFGSSPDLIGRSLVLNGTSYLIIGVIPSSFSFYGHDRDVYTPIGQWNDPSFRDRRISVSAHVIGRLRANVSLGQAKADMDSIATHLAEQFPVADKGAGITLVPLKEDIVGRVTPLLWVLFAAVGFLLLIACANLANLLLARSTGRTREFAVRAALGAGQRRIIAQLLVESILLAAAGGALGLLFAFAATRAVVQALPGTLPRAEEVSLDERVLLFTIALTLLSGIVFGLAPAFKASRVDLHEILKEGGRGSSGAGHRLQKVFVAGEVAMALVLLIGAGLMIRSLSALWSVNQGFNPSHAITFSLSMPSSASTTPAETRARLRQFDDRMRAIPAVQAVSVTLGSRPMIHDSSLPLWIEGRPKPASDNDMPAAMFYLVEAGFEQAMGITLQRGRFVGPQDNEGSPIVIDIDDVFARTYFRGEDPIGKYVNLTQFNVRAEVVGVVGHIKQWGPGADEKAAIEAQFFYPFMQLPDRIMALAAAGVAVVLRTEGDPAAVMKEVRQAVAELDSREVVYAVQTLDEVVAQSLSARRISMILLSIFAGLALLLACLGIYGVISYVVGQRTREIGLRMALGAKPGDVMRLVIQDGAKMTLAGIVAGLFGAFAMTRLMTSGLYGVSAQDPLTFLGVGVVLSLVALLACYLPARRAVRVDPVVALRCE